MIETLILPLRSDIAIPAGASALVGAPIRFAFLPNYLVLSNECRDSFLIESAEIDGCNIELSEDCADGFPKQIFTPPVFVGKYFTVVVKNISDIEQPFRALVFWKKMERTVTVYTAQDWIAYLSKWRMARWKPRSTITIDTSALISLTLTVLKELQ